VLQVVKMDHVMQMVVRTVINFVRARGLDHRHLTDFSVIRHFFDLHGEMENFVFNNQFQISLNFLH